MTVKLFKTSDPLKVLPLELVAMVMKYLTFPNIVYVLSLSQPLSCSAVETHCATMQRYTSSLKIMVFAAELNIYDLEPFRFL